MTIYPAARWINCPSCDGQIRILGYPRLGDATSQWTDGKPPWLGPSDLKRCPSCEDLFWLGDVSGSGWPAPPPRFDAPTVRELSVAELRDALEAGVPCTMLEERHVRRALRWALNDLARMQSGCMWAIPCLWLAVGASVILWSWRTQKGVFFWVLGALATAIGLGVEILCLYHQGQRAAWSRGKLRRPREDNLRQLSKLLDENEPEQKIEKADVLRELGRFEQALALLEGRFPGDLAERIARVRQSAERNDRSPQFIFRRTPGAHHSLGLSKPHDGEKIWT